MLAPFFVTSTALTSGMAGWAVLAAVFLAAGAGRLGDRASGRGAGRQLAEPKGVPAQRGP